MTLGLEHKAQQMLGADIAAAERNYIDRLPDGGYSVFGTWVLRQASGVVEARKRGELVQRFHDLKSALSWCIAEKYQQHELVQEILRLDRDLQRLAPTDQVRHGIAQLARDPVRRSVLRIKSQEAHIRHELVARRMARCVARAKYLQTRGFNDEIARTRRPAPNRTSRDSDRKSGRSAR